jgi:hypothetical protein
VHVGNIRFYYFYSHIWHPVLYVTRMKYLNIVSRKNPLDDKTTSNGSIAPCSLVMNRGDILLLYLYLFMFMNT